MTTTKAVRRTGHHEETIAATMASLFPLACPVEEYKWIDGWDFEMIYSECGAMENRCIFTERLTGAFLFADPSLETTWIVCEHDRDNHRLHVVLVTGDCAAGHFEVDGLDEHDGSSRVVWNFTITGLSEDGNEALAKLEPGRIDVMLAVLGKSFKHYGETGEKLPAADALERALASQ